MSEPALIAEIRRLADNEIEAAWLKARAEVNARREASDRSIADERTRTAHELHAVERAAEAEECATAEAAARRIRADAKAALAARVYELAVAELPRFRDEHYPVLFRGLVHDLPARDWQRVVVHPLDEALARTSFPTLEVVCDPAVDAGVVVEAEDGRVRVSNTLRTRLDAAWPDIMPIIMRGICELGARP